VFWTQHRQWCMKRARDGGEPERWEEGEGGCRGGLMGLGRFPSERHELHFWIRSFLNGRRLRSIQCVRIREAGFLLDSIGRVRVRRGHRATGIRTPFIHTVGPPIELDARGAGALCVAFLCHHCTGINAPGLLSKDSEDSPASSC